MQEIIIKYFYNLFKTSNMEGGLTDRGKVSQVTEEQIDQL